MKPSGGSAWAGSLARYFSRGSARETLLVIRGEKKAEKEEKGEQYHHKESSYGAFHRNIPLPAEVEEDKIEATYKKGVLKISLPKSSEAQKARKKITVH